MFCGGKHLAFTKLEAIMIIVITIIVVSFCILKFDIFHCQWYSLWNVILRLHLPSYRTSKKDFGEEGGQGGSGHENYSVKEACDLPAYFFFFLENLRSELLRVQQEEMQRLHREFEIQLAAMKLQLQRANELHSSNVSVIVRLWLLGFYISQLDKTEVVFQRVELPS